MSAEVLMVSNRRRAVDLMADGYILDSLPILAANLSYVVIARPELGQSLAFKGDLDLAKNLFEKCRLEFVEKNQSNYNYLKHLAGLGVDEYEEYVLVLSLAEAVLDSADLKDLLSVSDSGPSRGQIVASAMQAFPCVDELKRIESLIRKKKMLFICRSLAALDRELTISVAAQYISWSARLTQVFLSELK